MDISEHNIQIVGIEPRGDNTWEDVHFTVGDDQIPYEFCYNIKRPNKSWFSDTPEEIEHSHDEEAIKYFINLVNNYKIKNQLTPNTLKTFGELIDEL